MLHNTYFIGMHLLLKCRYVHLITDCRCLICPRIVHDGDVWWQATRRNKEETRKEASVTFWEGNSSSRFAERTMVLLHAMLTQPFRTCV
jgi:hypothetical protein